MCRLCDEGKPQDHTDPKGITRREFLKTSAVAGAGAAGLFGARTAAARDDDDRDDRDGRDDRDDHDDPPRDSGRHGRRIIIRGGAVMTMDPSMPHKGEFPRADVLIEGKKILAVGPNLHAGGADVIDARDRIIMPGFIDTHHHQFETALRSFLADGVLINDKSDTPSGKQTYFEFILLTLAPVYRPRDVYISEVLGGLSQLDGGVTTVHDVSQIHHSPEHSDAAIQALFDTGRRAAFGYFESAGGVPGNQYPKDAFRIKKRWFSSSDQLVHMIMGGEVYLGDPTTDESWTIGRKLGLQIAAHTLSPFGIRPIMDALAQGKGGNGSIGIGADNLFIHMTGMSDEAWQATKDAGAQVSLAVPIEMNMRHGIPPILKMQSLGMEPSLSVDVECTLTADFFTQMRSMMNMQRMVVNQMILEQGDFYPPNQWPTPNLPDWLNLLTTRDVLRYATINGAKALRLEKKVGSLTPGKEADIIILDPTKINVAPLNHVPGAVVSLMDRTNVETVIVAGKVRKWKGKLLGFDLPKLLRELERSRDYIFNAAGIDQDLFNPN